jgi:hypothetical protein
MRDRTPFMRPYFFEIFATLNLAVIAFLASRSGMRILPTIPRTFYSMGLPFLGQMLAGILVRLVVAARRGEAAVLWRRYKTAGWWTDSLRLLVFATILADSYSWVKLTMPVIHPVLFDRALWDLDRTLFFGYSPNIFFLSLFSPHAVLRVVDWCYANVFLASLTVAFAFFLSAPSRRIRVGFMSGMNILWMTGAWLYMLIPSLGPAYYFPDVWFAYGDALKRTQFLQATLMRNYQNFLRVRAGGNEAVNILLGIAAFPSMHVGFQTFAFLWFRRLWLSGQVIFGIFVLFIFLGSIITGWHYLIDAYAGLLLAAVAYGVTARIFRIGEWERLRRAVAHA